jgi:shikimate dehydrogenase
MKRAGVIGDPVEHSLSPHMQNAALREAGIDAQYELWQTSLEDLPARIASLRSSDILGANVTVPHKQAVMELVDDVTDVARKIGAVNTIIPTKDGLLGDNTDAYGFRTSITEKIGMPLLRTVVVLGAGGASRAVIVALEEMDADRVVIANRTDSRAATLAQEFGVEMAPWSAVREMVFSDVDFLVNATSLGWQDELPISEKDLSRLPKQAVVMDLTYRDTALLRAASARGHAVLDGLGMLIHQGARAFELWTGIAAPVEVMRSAVLAEQAKRG